VNPEKLKEILDAHEAWLNDPATGKEANLRGVDLRGADLKEANLRGVDLRGADLRGVDLQNTNLRWANLKKANLEGANLQGTYLRAADLREANLRGAFLEMANLREANLRGVDLGVTNRLARAIRLLGACWEACEWVDKQNRNTWEELIAICPDVSWINWLEERGLV